MISHKWILGLEILLGIIVVLNVGFIGFTYVNKTYINKKSAPTTGESAPTKSPEILPTPDLLGKLLVTATPTPALIFDTTMGNNYYAAKYASSVSAIINSLPEGQFKGLYVYFEPVDIGRYSQNEYFKSILKSARVTLQFDAATWDATPDDVKKSFVSKMVKALHFSLNIYPEVVITNGVKTVATGDWSTSTSDVIVKLQ